MAWRDIFATDSAAAVKQRDVGDAVWSAEWRRAGVSPCKVDAGDQQELYSGAEPWLTLTPVSQNAVHQDIVYSSKRRRVVWVDTPAVACCSSDEERDDDEGGAPAPNELQVPLRKPTVLSREARRLQKSSARPLHRAFGGALGKGLLNTNAGPHPASWRPPVLISLSADRLSTALHELHGDVEPLWLSVSCWTPSAKVCETFHTSFYSGPFRPEDEDYDSRREPKGCLLHIPYDLFASSTPCYLLLKVHRLLTGDDHSFVSGVYRSAKPKASEAAKLRKKAAEAAGRGWVRRSELGWGVVPLCGGDVAWGDGSVRVVEIDNFTRSGATTAPEWCLAEHLSESGVRRSEIPLTLELRVENVPLEAVHVYKPPEGAATNPNDTVRRCMVGGRVLVACAPQLPLPSVPPQQLRTEMYVKLHALMLLKTKVMGTECRTFIIEACVKDTDNLRDPPLARCLLDRDGRGLVDKQYTSVSYHQKEAFFDDDFVIQLPPLAGGEDRDTHRRLHLFFTIYHITFKSSKAERDLIAVGHSMKLLGRGEGCVVGDHTCHLPVLSTAGDGYREIYEGTRGYFDAFRSLEQLRTQGKTGEKDVVAPTTGGDISVGMLDAGDAGAAGVVGRKLSNCSASSATSIDTSSVMRGGGGSLATTPTATPRASAKAERDADKAVLQQFCEGGKRCLVMSLSARTTFHTVAQVASQPWTPTSLFLLMPVGLSSTRFLHAQAGPRADPVIEVLMHLAEVTRPGGVCAGAYPTTPVFQASPSRTSVGSVHVDPAPPVDDKDVDDLKDSVNFDGASSIASSSVWDAARSMRGAARSAGHSDAGSAASPVRLARQSRGGSCDDLERSLLGRVQVEVLARLRDLSRDDTVRWFPVLANQLLAVLHRVGAGADRSAEGPVLQAFLDLLGRATERPADDDAVAWYCDAVFSNALVAQTPSVPVWRVLLRALSRQIIKKSVRFALGAPAVHRRVFQIVLRSYLLTLARDAPSAGASPSFPSFAGKPVAGGFSLATGPRRTSGSLRREAREPRRASTPPPLGSAPAPDEVAVVFENFAQALGDVAGGVENLPLSIATAWGELLAETAGVLGAASTARVLAAQNHSRSAGAAVHTAASIRALLGRVANPYPLLAPLSPCVVDILRTLPSDAPSSHRSIVVDTVTETVAIAIGSAAYEHERQVIYAAGILAPVVPELMAMLTHMRNTYRDEAALVKKQTEKLTHTIESMKTLAWSAAASQEKEMDGGGGDAGGAVVEDMAAIANTIFEKQTALAECDESMDWLRKGEVAETRKIYAAVLTLVQCVGCADGDCDATAGRRWSARALPDADTADDGDRATSDPECEGNGSVNNGGGAGRGDAPGTAACRIDPAAVDLVCRALPDILTTFGEDAASSPAAQATYLEAARVAVYMAVTRIVPGDAAWHATALATARALATYTPLAATAGGSGRGVAGMCVGAALRLAEGVVDAVTPDALWDDDNLRMRDVLEVVAAAFTAVPLDADDLFVRLMPAADDVRWEVFMRDLAAALAAMSGPAAADAMEDAIHAARPTTEDGAESPVPRFVECVHDILREGRTVDKAMCLVADALRGYQTAMHS